MLLPNSTRVSGHASGLWVMAHACVKGVLHEGLFACHVSILLKELLQGAAADLVCISCVLHGFELLQEQ